MTEDEIVYIRILSYIFLGKKHQVLLLLAHIGRLAQWIVSRRLMLHTTVPGPVQTEGHAQVGMQPAEQPLADRIMEDGTQKAERLAFVAQSVAMCQEKCLTLNHNNLRPVVHDNAALPGQIVLTPDIMIAREEVNGNPPVSKL